MKRYCAIPTPLGEMTAVAEDVHLCELRFADERQTPAPGGDGGYAPELPLFTELRRQLDAYFAGTLRGFDLPLLLRGTPFREAVWALLRTIPHGSTTTYGALARHLAAGHGGRQPAAQAVGGAVGQNPVAIIVPCHRVIGADGSLTGYAGGLHRKAALLELEKR